LRGEKRKKGKEGPGCGKEGVPIASLLSSSSFRPKCGLGEGEGGKKGKKKKKREEERRGGEGGTVADEKHYFHFFTFLCNEASRKEGEEGGKRGLQKGGFPP